MDELRVVPLRRTKLSLSFEDDMVSSAAVLLNNVPHRGRHTGVCDMARVIGIRHRIKQTKEGKAKPTELIVLDGGNTITYELEDENAELDFVLGRFPTEFRKPTDDEDLKKFLPHHIKWRKVAAEERERYPANLLKQEEKLWYRVSSVAVAESFDGLKAGDTVAMVLGGSGDNLAYTLSKRGELVGAKVLRVPPFTLSAERGTAGKEQDAALLAQLAQNKPTVFYETGPRDRQMIMIREAYRAREEIMKERIACEQRIRQNLVGKIFRTQDGQYPEGSIEEQYQAAKANDVILKNLLDEEKRRAAELNAALGDFPVYRTVFGPIKGVGPMTAARLIGAVIDIRRFPTKFKFVKFCGAHILEDGRFPRRRHGEVANWNPSARQALFLLGEQFNRRPGSYWGQKLLANKVRLKEKHPEPVETEGGKKRYTPGHLHKTGLWRTRTQFARSLWGAWWAWEKEQNKKEEVVQ